MNLIDFAEAGWVPDKLVRMGIRRLLNRRRRTLMETSEEKKTARLSEFVQQLRRSPLAVATELANEQHYEVPAEFFAKVLGPWLKYSCCLFAQPDCSLAEAEEAMLQKTCQRAEIADGHRVLELGCGWGSLTLWMAERYPNSAITAVSNSASQKAYIERRARLRGIANVRVITADMRNFDTAETFDRVVSVEMFEHMRNYELLLRRIARWLAPDGKLFVHIFCHRDSPYVFETEGASNWMGRHFFTGGMMPSDDLLSQFDDTLTIERQWQVSGLHYAKTCEAWLNNLDQHYDEILARFSRDLPDREARRTVQRWRMFFMACAELFRYGGGYEWFVSHYRLRHAHAVQRRSFPVKRVASRPRSPWMRPALP